MRFKGKIASWNDNKGYGFITPLAGGKQIFVHINAFGNRARRPELNEVVTYAMSKDKQGRPCAANATLAGDKLVRKSARKTNKRLVHFALLFLAGVAGAVMAGKLPLAVLVAYAALSIVTFIAYALDKSAARHGRWRTPESTLLMLGLAGGWPGALIAQQTLRHKSKKTSFIVALWVTVLVNGIALAWATTPDGLVAVQGLLS
tara:strand:+ start:24013 stop:24621 length:609 start_codon:yes stop_codon:yes gene_type:complete